MDISGFSGSPSNLSSAPVYVQYDSALFVIVYAFPSSAVTRLYAVAVEFAMAVRDRTGRTFVARGTHVFSNSETFEEVPEGPAS